MHMQRNLAQTCSVVGADDGTVCDMPCRALARLVAQLLTRKQHLGAVWYTGL